MGRQTSISNIITTFIANDNSEKNIDINKGDYIINVINGSKIFLSSGDVSKYGILIDENNNVGIGKKPTSELDISGKLNISNGLLLNNTEIIDCSGNFYLPNNITINNSLSIANDKFKVDNNGNIHITGNLITSNNFSIKDLIEKDEFNNIIFPRKSIIKESLIINGDLFINDIVSINKTGDIYFKGNINQYGSLNINDNTFIIDSSTGNLYSQGTIDISGNLRVNDKLLLNASNGDIISSGKLNIDIIETNKLYIKDKCINDISLNGNILINGHNFSKENIIINNNLTIKDTLSCNKLSLGNNEIIFDNKELKINTNTLIANTFKINSDELDFDNCLNIKDNVIKLKGEININDKLLISDKFYIDDNFILDSNKLNVKNNEIKLFSDNIVINSTNTILSGNTKIEGLLDISNINDRIYIDKLTNNIGIGTFKPLDTLHINGNTRIDGNLIVNGETTIINTSQQNTDQLIITNHGTGSALKVNQLGIQNIVDFEYNNKPVITITNSGNLGINTQNPQEQLDIVGNAIIRNKLIINELESIHGYLNIKNKLLLSDNNDSISIEYINNNLKINDTLNIDKISKNVLINGSLDISNKLNINNNFFIDGFSGNTNILGSLIIGDDLLTINPITNDLKFKDLFIMDGHLKNIKINGSLDVNDLTITNKLNIIGNLNICNILTVDHNNGRTIIGSILDVCNDAIIYGDLTTKNINGNHLKIKEIHSDQNILFKTNDTISVIINDKGFIGINTINPTENLDVNGVIRSSSGYDVNGFKICDNDGNIFAKSIKSISGALIIDNNNININNGQLYVNNNGFIGINTIKPEYELDIYGNINISGILYQKGEKYLSSQWKEINRNIFYMENVGIGVTNPIERLHINNGLLINNCDTYIKIKSDQNNYISSNKDIILEDNNQEWMRFSNKSICYGTSIANASVNIVNDRNIPSLILNHNSNSDFIKGYINNNPSFIINNEGKVGLGIEKPKSYLDININSLDKAVTIKQNGLGDIFEVSNQNGTIMYISENSYVGIGTNIPGAKLDIFDNDENYALKINQIGNGELMWLLNGIHTRMIVKNDGNIGIGTMNPRATLEISKPGCKKLQFTNDILTHRQIVLWEKDDNEHQFTGIGTNNGSLRYQIHNTNNNHIFYAGTSNKTSNELLRISGEGNLGIGNTNPTAKIDISTNDIMAIKISQTCGEAINVNDKLIITSEGTINLVNNYTYIESPQKDIIYRGKIKMENGKGNVNLNFPIKNPDIYLQNNDSFDRVIGKIEDNTLLITCENNHSNDLISWMIIIEK